MALKRLEPSAGKLARTVFRGAVAGNSHGLSDNLPNLTQITRIEVEGNEQVIT